MEIIVDAYNESEVWTGWYCYLENTLAFPFEAESVKSRKMSPLKPGERVTVLGNAGRRRSRRPRRNDGRGQMARLHDGNCPCADQRHRRGRENRRGHCRLALLGGAGTAVLTVSKTPNQRPSSSRIAFESGCAGRTQRIRASGDMFAHLLHDPGDYRMANTLFVDCFGDSLSSVGNSTSQMAMRSSTPEGVNRSSRASFSNPDGGSAGSAGSDSLSRSSSPSWPCVGGFAVGRARRWPGHKAEQAAPEPGRIDFLKGWFSNVAYHKIDWTVPGSYEHEFSLGYRFFVPSPADHPLSKPTPIR